MLIREDELNKTINSFVDYLLFERGCSKNTSAAYISDLKFWIKYCKQAKSDPLDLNPNIIQRYILELHGNGLKKASIQRKNAMLRSFTKFLQFNDITKNFSCSEHMPQQENKLPEIMTEGEIQRIINACEDGTVLGSRDRIFIELAYKAGMRAQELCNLKLSDLDAEHRVLYVHGKDDKERAIPFIGALQHHVQEYIKTYRPLLDKHGEEWLFLSRNGHQLDREYLWVIMHKRGIAACIAKERLHPHILRNTFATHLLNNGMDQRTLQEILGYTSIMTNEQYTHIDTELRDYYDKYHPRAK